MRYSGFFIPLFCVLALACSGTRKPVEKPYRQIILESFAGNDTALLRQTIDILTERLEDAGFDQNEFSFAIDSGRIEGRFSLEAVPDPARLRKLLQADAKLFFRETYTLGEIIESVQKADELLKMLRDSGQINLSGRFENDQRRLFEILKIALPDPQQMQAGGSYMFNTPLVGMAELQDTSKINELLNHEKIRISFPSDLAFYWTAHPVPEAHGNMYGLIAVKTGINSTFKPGRLEEVAIKKGDDSPNGFLEITMTKPQSIVWARMTKKNIDRAIAIEMDGLVYSYPIVQSEITGGKSHITGGESTDLEELKIIMQPGSLPASVRIVEAREVR